MIKKLKIALIFILTVICCVCSASCTTQRSGDFTSADLTDSESYKLTPCEDVSDGELADAADKLRERLKHLGLKDNQYKISVAGREITAELPKDLCSETALSYLFSQSELTFRAYDNTTLLTNGSIKHAKAGEDQDGNPIVVLEFTAESQKTFASLTEKVASYEDCRLYIYLGDFLLSKPYVFGKIDSLNYHIVNIGTAQDAKIIATVIECGPLPIELKMI
ncbi:MAG: hypothetical protein IKA61_03145 [Clostridia bacterium]|nr:hypothetical protein [Clostridia bacterium]